jgi:stearoyl-CoA desaturase (delta-9 desaturase)
LCSVAASGSIWSWSVIHRIHHKYSDTNADPVNSKRGFWFSHIGWTMQTVHPKVVEKANNVDFSDLEADWFVRFNRDYYTHLIIICCYLMPAAIPTYFWGESYVTAFLICSVLRHVLQLHGTFAINSFAHMFGDRPYNAKIRPTQNFWANLYTFGEGFHNYHHTFPSDYRASEFGWSWNMTTIFLDAMRLFGLAYDCKTTSDKVIENTKINNSKRLAAKSD